MKMLPEFGKGSRADEFGHDLEFMIGWLEEMIEFESEICESDAPLRDRRARLEQAEDAVQLLQEVSDWSPLLTKAYLKKVKEKRCPPPARKL